MVRTEPDRERVDIALYIDVMCLMRFAVLCVKVIDNNNNNNNNNSICIALHPAT